MWEEVARRYGGVPDAVLRHRELRGLCTPALRADFAILAGYEHHPGEPLSCPVTGLFGEDETLVNREEMARWAELSTAPLAVRSYPGGHFYLTTARDRVLADIGTELQTRSPIV